MRFILPIVFIAAMGSVSSSQQPSFRSVSGEVVVLPVVVTDKDGRFVPGLTADRFAVFDNNRRQPVTLFSAEDTPVSLALVIDDSGSMSAKLPEVIAAATSFVEQSNPEDEVFAIEFNDSVRDALGGARLAASDSAALQAALRTLRPAGRTALYDALMTSLARLNKTTLTRKVLLLISDGGDNASAASLDQVLERARESDVTIYTIGLFDPGAPDSNGGVLKRLASTTGGERFLPRSPGVLIQTCRQIAREIRSGYTIGFEPPARDAQYHQVRVQIDGRDAGRMKVRTRPGYFAGTGRPD
jgi:Ca-activated chloride channel family protein